MQIFTRVRGHFAFNGLSLSETDETKILNWRNVVILYILFEYMALAIKYLCTEAESLTEYADSFQVTATTTVNFLIFGFMVMQIPEMYELMDTLEQMIEQSESFRKEKMNAKHSSKLHVIEFFWKQKFVY